MAKIEIVESLFEEIENTFKGRSTEVFDLIETLEANPHKGKSVGRVGEYVIKEIKYEKFRFYFILDGYKLKCFTEKELVDLLIRFVRMSDKKSQQKVIDEVKRVLVKIGPAGFE
ncbi:hypothetical protein J4211_02680 [Candidatus Woesearchaeota archaeon]|nr:hypothetical protein [Candidatus Woesearchaeota archaeon]